jgi:putative inorganic carbon (HCO3(-)) transporter
LRDKLYNLFTSASEYAVYGLLFFLPISIALVESFAGLLLFGFVVRKIVKPDLRYLKSLPNLFLLFFILFSVFSMLNSGQYIDKSLHALAGKWAQYLGVYLIIQDTVRSRKIFKRALAVFLSGAFLAVLSGVSQYSFGIEFLRGRNIIGTDTGIAGITSSFAHYNDFGSYLVVVVSLLFALLLSQPALKAKRFGLLIFSMFSITAIVLTLSRGSWLGLAASCIFLFVFSGKDFKRLAPIFLVAAAMFLFPVFRERLFFTFKEGGDSDRFRYWIAAWKMINDHPFFGMGVGTFMANFSKYLPGVNISYTHNCYLQIWAETGIWSLMSFVGFVVSLVYLGVKKFIATKDFLLLGLLSGVIGFLAHNFFDTSLYSLRLAVLFWAWAGLISAKIYSSAESG